MAPRVLIAMPMYAHVAPQAVASFTSFLCQNLGRNAVNIFQTVDMYVDNARNQAVSIGLGHNDGNLKDISHILFIDSDMTLPTDGLDKLLEHNLPVVGALYFAKVPPYPPVAFNLEPYKRWGWYKDNSLEPVECLGMGFTLVQTQVFRDMEKHFGDKMWFSTGHGVGEDVWFFRRLKEMGITSYLDTSVKCGHVSALIVGWNSFENKPPTEVGNGTEPKMGEEVKNGCTERTGRDLPGMPVH